jgi:hypothetical protein
MRTRRTSARRKHRSFEFSTWLAIQSRGPVCERWRSFGTFYRDVHPRPSWRHLLIRTDSSGEFSPDNCRWQIAKWYRRRRPAGAKAVKSNRGRRPPHG